jgi:hypothetical protein
MRVLLQPAIAHLGKAEHSLDDPDRRFDPGPHLGLGAVFRPLGFVDDAAVTVAAIGEIPRLGRMLSDNPCRWPPSVPSPPGAAAPRRTAAGPDRAPPADGGSGTPWSPRTPARGQEPALAKAGVDADKTAHRQQIVKPLLHRRVRQIEPLLQEIEAQHRLDPNWRAAIARLRIERRDQRAQRRPRHNRLHPAKKRCSPRRLGVALKSYCRSVNGFIPRPMQQSTPPNIIPRSLQLAYAEVP